MNLIRIRILLGMSVFLLLLLHNADGAEENCTDFQGNVISHGFLYVPGPNVCSLCVCYHNEPMWCKTIFCPGPPYKCLKFVTGAECCEFTCLDDPKDKLKKNNSSSLNDTNSKVSLLLVTAFLFLSYHHFIRHVLN
ncbi:unnamed protein product [Bemisia tabaci]|uniref:Integral membrane protein DGCR2/IDD n=1 Tax=Bemisia tabaci TaxID=7038 RepID=A0A9P0EZE3_BEMTA|nr:PREDICTED: uncharacterized protein LOC109030103 [Bemisia tabaci]CAH0385451.1 unnamed protein product [Bemisia tabaci]